MNNKPKRIILFTLLLTLFYSCQSTTESNVSSGSSFADAGVDQITYVGSYVILDPSESKIDEEIEIIEWIQDVYNPEEVYAFAHSTLQEINVVGFQIEGIYRFILKINCVNEDFYTDSITVTVQPRQNSLIEDINLETRIRHRLEYKEGKLTAIKLGELDSLSTADIAVKNRIQSIEGIEFCTNLTYLLLGNQSISDLQPLSSLTQLETLDLNQNYTIEDISPIYNLTNLKFLSLYSNPIEDISSLGYLTKLTELYLMYAPISDISPLSSLVNLEILYLSGVGEVIEFNSIEPLRNLTKLRHLHITGGGITDITPLENLTELLLLNLNYNNLTEISSIYKMAKLVRLYIRRNNVNNISGIENLENLDYLDAADNQIENISELQNLPNIHLIGLSGNQIEDISPLVNNTNLGTGVYLFLNNNPLDETSINEYIPILIQRGVAVYY
ncbi:MAG: leucine-rich repeat domain-containing protein [Calditrichaeota bacterium]|nr:leucine-rich repeat domain-containing protein [Calditrichota bacterium]